MSIREEGRTTYVYPHRVQSSTDAWIPKDEEIDVWNSKDEGTYVWIPKERGTYVWIPKDAGETDMKKKKTRRGRPQFRLPPRERAHEQASREHEKRDQASPVEPNDVVKPSSPAAGDEGSSSR